MKTCLKELILMLILYTYTNDLSNQITTLRYPLKNRLLGEIAVEKVVISKKIENSVISFSIIGLMEIFLHPI